MQSTAERVSLGVSALLVLALVGVLVFEEISGEDRPPMIEVAPRLEEVRQSGQQFYLPVDVFNRGDETAEDVRVRVSLEPPELGEESEVEVRFLSGGERTKAVVVFRSDPRTTAVRSQVLSHAEP